jgi:hypothetical protein
MTAFSGPVPLAPTGSTGNNTHAGVGLQDSADKLAVEIVGEVIGATPTLTVAVQGTMAKDNVSDAAALWFPLMLLPSDSDVGATTRVVTALGSAVSYLSQAHTRFVKRVRVVTTANTNYTYSVNLYQQIKP